MQNASHNSTHSVITWLTLALFVLVGAAVGGTTVAAAEDAAKSFIEYRVKPGDTLIKICGLFRDQTNHYALTDLLTDIRETNQLESNLLSIGQTLQIPVLPEADCARVVERVADGAELRGIYLTGPACGASSVFARVDRFIAAGGNAVVFDAKDIDGGVAFRSHHPLASWGKGRSAPVIPSLSDMMARLDRRGVYVVARIALFLDRELGLQRPDLAHADENGEPWSERGCYWIDPSRPEVGDYNLTLARELAAAGVDEIQFDYVRFPTNGWRGDWQGDLDRTADLRREVISDFLAAARDTLSRFDVKLSADLYGIMAWGRVEDLALTGQHVPTLARYLDVICPMIYPSHFGPGFEGRSRPGDDPEYFITEGTERFVALADGQATIRPWLQAFPYRVTRFDGDYIDIQVQAARTAGGQGWCLWNPTCRYNVALSVLPDLCAPDRTDPVEEPATLLAAAETGASAAASMASPAPVTAAGSSGDPSSQPVVLPGQVGLVGAMTPTEATGIQ